MYFWFYSATVSLFPCWGFYCQVFHILKIDIREARSTTSSISSIVIARLLTQSCMSVFFYLFLYSLENKGGSLWNVSQAPLLLWTIFDMTIVQCEILPSVPQGLSHIPIQLFFLHRKRVFSIFICKTAFRTHRGCGIILGLQNYRWSLDNSQELRIFNVILVLSIGNPDRVVPNRL